MSARREHPVEVPGLLPVAPLLLTTFSVEQLLDRVLKVLF